jgi:integrase
MLGGGSMGVKVREKVKDSGVWWVFINHQGKRKSKQVGAKKSAFEVKRLLDAKLALGDFSFEDDKPAPTFQEYSDAWMKTTVPATCKKTTQDDYESLLDSHITPVFGTMRLTDITRGKVKDFLLSKINEGKAHSTVKHMKSVISGVMEKALDDEVIVHNPARNLGRIIKTADKSAGIDPLTVAELNTLLSKVQEKYSDHYPMFLLLARTGLRIGEAIALKWDDVDFNGRFVEVKRSIVRGRTTTPKSGKSRRVDLSRQLVSVLKQHWKVAKKKGMKLGLGEAPAYIFTNKAGNPVDPNTWRRRVFKKALEKAELRQIRIHDLRHTYATMRIAKGDNIADVSNQLGHYSIKLTLDTYYHWMPGKNKSEVDGLDNMLPDAPHAHPATRKNEKGSQQIAVTP